MENKVNEPTSLRPGGERVLNAPLVKMDLDKYMEQIKSEKTWKEGALNSITIFKSSAMRIVLIGMRKAAILKEHSADAVISVQLLKGNIRFLTEKENIILTQGQMIALHDNLPHSVDALEESFFLLTLATK